MLLFKGIIIGIGKIIPGVSGSMIAISLGIYHKLIDSINNFFKHPKESFNILLKVSIGIVISIVLFSKVIYNALNNHYIITIFFFIGLILGGLNDISDNIDKNSKYIIYILAIFILAFGLLTINNEFTTDNAIIAFLYFVLIGFIDALTTIIPGISGTATLMMLGAYTPIIKMFSTIFDFYYFMDNLKIMIPFGLGFIIGVLVTAKAIDYLLSRYKKKSYNFVLGFGIGTILIMFINGFKSHYTVVDLIIAFIMLFIGYFLTKKINHLFSD